MIHVEEGTLALKNGTSMYYFSFGSGKKPFVIIPGLSVRNYKGMAKPFSFLYRIFAKDFKVYVFDRPMPVKKGITAEQIAEHINEGMWQLHIEGAAVLGVSQGGMIAQYLSLNHPERVDRLVLAVTLCRNNETIKHSIYTWSEYAARNDFDGLIEDLFTRMYTKEYMDKHRRFLPVLTKIAKPMSAKRFRILANACMTCDTYDRLPTLTQPVLIIGGRKDNIVTAEASEEIYSQLKKRGEGIETELYIYEDGGHSIYEEAGDFNERVLAFLTRQKV